MKTIFLLVTCLLLFSCGDVVSNSSIEPTKILAITETVVTEGELFSYSGPVTLVATENMELIILLKEKVADYNAYLHVVLQTEEGIFPEAVLGTHSAANLSVFEDRCLLSFVGNERVWIIGVPQGLQKNLDADLEDLIVGFGFVVQGLSIAPVYNEYDQISSMLDILPSSQEGDLALTDPGTPAKIPCTTISCSYSNYYYTCSVTCYQGYNATCNSSGCMCVPCNAVPPGRTD